MPKQKGLRIHEQRWEMVNHRSDFSRWSCDGDLSSRLIWIRIRGLSSCDIDKFACDWPK